MERGHPGHKKPCEPRTRGEQVQSSFSERCMGWECLTVSDWLDGNQNSKSLESFARKFKLDSTGNVELSDVFDHRYMFSLGRLDVYFTTAVLSQNIYSVPPKCQSM